MYHCHLHFYCLSHRQELPDAVRAIPPLEHFTHTVSQSSQPDKALAAQADVILADLRELDGPEAAALLASEKKAEAALILLTEQAQIHALEPCLDTAADLWILPMSSGELSFRLRRLQTLVKDRADAWQINHFLEATINSTPNLIWYKDKNGIHEKVNDSFCETVGKTKEQVQGRGHAYIWDVEQDDPACIESERIVMENRETCVSEETVQTGGGTRLLTTYKSPLYDMDGSVMGTVGIAIDVTQERSYEQELIAKTQTLETLFTTMDCGIMCHSLDGSRILSVNRAALEILGYSSEAELAADGFDMVAASVLDEDKPKLREAILSLHREGDSVNVEYQVRHTNGTLRHVMGNIKLIRKGGDLFYQRFLLDCTAQKQREREVRMETERRHRSLVQALASDYNLVCFFDLNTGLGEPIRTHACPFHILDSLFDGKHPIEHSMERYIQTCVYEDDQEMLRQAVSIESLREELDERSTFYLNYRTLCGGETRYFQMKAVRTGDWDSSHGVVLGFRSVDEETRSEMEKKALLEDALAQANRASKAKSTFLSNMSHDIRTPMNAIIGFTALATTHIDQKEQVAGYLKKIMTSGNHLLSLINDVLDMSRIESGKIFLEEKPCSLPDILHGLRNIVQADVHAKQLELYMDAVDVKNEGIYCDRLRLNQVLLNLLGNSIKYTPAGGVVSVRVIEMPGAPAGWAKYEFRVKDTGIGMSEEFVSRIFEPFERERNSTTSGIQGTGLGMAITKNIVDMMNGAIDVQSRQGAGTEFTVTISFRLCSDAAVPQTISELKNSRALVVDDDFNTCDSVSSMLQQIGMRAEWTLSGKEAVLRTRQAVMRNDQYYVYIIDWLLPDMNGVEVARRVRKECGEDVPIIVLTAYDWSDIEDEAREAGITAFCSKPLFLSELRSCLLSVVGTEEISLPETEEKPAVRTGCILLAEDNELNQEIAQAILEEVGFSVEIAGNGQTAVEMLRTSQPGHYQLVLMDVQMPVMNGYDATQAIRKLENPDLAAIPILAMTANAFEEDKQEALRSGMNGHIAKPIDIDELMKALDTVLQ
ncbi:PAS domain-containing hybrid sensor histidine kinase/response regulator [uncultured Oscillibacter sp.]|uniref:PAS domain-containing hybrid sensor histidine kinase/response regulator n=1 Tax=uncultured Oscillibacter sp. TaxID=876091 RepID=UPI0025EE3486|nr:PAS domain-containing hybrid sensor histidine kinase/response regulator [uncultured Oscillibacter sp.]